MKKILLRVYLGWSAIGAVTFVLCLSGRNDPAFLPAICTASKAGEYTASVQAYHTAYRSGDLLVLSYAALVWPAKEPKVEAWELISLRGVIESAKGVSRNNVATYTVPSKDIHLNERPPGGVPDAQDVPIIRGISSMHWKDPSVIPAGAPIVFMVVNGDDSGGALSLYIRDGPNGPVWSFLSKPLVHGRRDWGYPALVAMLPFALSVDVVTLPLTWPFWLGRIQ